MTDTHAVPTGRPVVRARTLPLQGLVNRLVRGLLSTPILSRIVGKRLVIVYVVGRKSGRRYTVPVAYTRSDASLLVGSQFTWIRNLRTGEPVDVLLGGVRRRSEVRVFTDEADVVQLLGTMASDNHQFAKFNRIGLDDHGNALPEDLRLAWAAGARVAMLTPH